MILPLASTRKHSVLTLPPRSFASPDSRSTDLHESWRLASGDGGASAVRGAMLVHAASMTGSKIRYTSSYLTVRHSRSTNTLSRQAPLGQCILQGLDADRHRHAAAGRAAA